MSDRSKYGHIIFTDPGYSLLTIGSMFLGIVIVWLVNSLYLMPLLASIDINISGYSLLLSSLNNFILFALVPYLYFKRRSIDYRIFTGINGRLSNNHIFTFVALAIGVFLFTQSAQFYWFKLLDAIGVDYSITSTPIEGFDELILGLIFIAVIPAITEEFLFRGVIMRSVAGVYGGARAVLISALLFSMMHMNIATLPTTFIVGLSTGFAVYKSNCLKSSVIMHFVHNLIVVLLSFLSFSVSSDTAAAQPSQTAITIYTVLGSLITLVTVLLINRRGALPRTLAAHKAAIPRKHPHDLLPFAVALLLMLVRMI